MLLHSDGFDSHATGATTLADGDSKWGAQSNVEVDATGGRFGGKALFLAGGDAGYLEFVATGAMNIAFAGWFKAAARTADVPLVADDGGALVVLAVDGSVEAYDGGGNLRVTSAAGLVADDTWAWIEVSYRSDGVYMNINGASVGTPYVGAYTAPNEDDLRLLDSPGTNVGDVFVDDFLVWDSAGSYFNTYGLAPRRIQSVNPNANGTTVQWTPNGATNWQSVSAADWSGGAGVYATVNGLKDRYGFGDLPVNPGSIDAVVLKTRVENTGGDPATITHISASGVTETSAAPQTAPIGAPETLSSVFYRDPAGAPWTPSTVNAAEFGQVLGV